MPVTTVHEYIDTYPVKHTDSKMILGTIHPHLTMNFIIPFYYGNVGSFWNLLGQAFPQHDFTTLVSIQAVLSKHKTWVADIIRKCDREDENVTRDALLYNIVYNSEQISDALNESQIDTIFFTSRFGKNNAASLFMKSFRINKNTYDKSTNEFFIPAGRFGRHIRCIALYSPSNDANKGISKGAKPYLNKIDYYKAFPHPIKQFKVEFYKQKFQYLNENIF